MPEFKLLCSNGCYLFHPEDAAQAEIDSAKVLEYRRLDKACGSVLENYYECEQQIAASHVEVEATRQMLADEVDNNRVAVWGSFALGAAVVLSFWFVATKIDQ